MIQLKNRNLAEMMCPNLKVHSKEIVNANGEEIQPKLVSASLHEGFLFSAVSWFVHGKLTDLTMLRIVSPGLTNM